MSETGNPKDITEPFQGEENLAPPTGYATVTERRFDGSFISGAGNDIFYFNDSFVYGVGDVRGDDFYVIGQYQIGNVNLNDVTGDNRVYFDDDFVINYARISGQGLILGYNNGDGGYSELRVRDANTRYKFYLGNNDTSLTVEQLITQVGVLQAPVGTPTKTLTAGGVFEVDDSLITASTDFGVTLLGGIGLDVFTLGFSQDGTLNGRAGADYYYLTRFQESTSLNLRDTEGSNHFIVEGGVAIADVSKSGEAIILDLANGGEIRIAGGLTKYSFHIGDLNEGTVSGQDFLNAYKDVGLEVSLASALQFADAAGDPIGVEGTIEEGDTSHTIRFYVADGIFDSNSFTIALQDDAATRAHGFSADNSIGMQALAFSNGMSTGNAAEFDFESMVAGNKDSAVGDYKSFEIVVEARGMKGSAAHTETATLTITATDIEDEDVVVSGGIDLTTSTNEAITLTAIDPDVISADDRSAITFDTAAFTVTDDSGTDISTNFSLSAIGQLTYTGSADIVLSAGTEYTLTTTTTETDSGATATHMVTLTASADGNLGLPASHTLDSFTGATIVEGTLSADTEVLTIAVEDVDSTPTDAVVTITGISGFTVDNGDIFVDTSVTVSGGVGNAIFEVASGQILNFEDVINKSSGVGTATVTLTIDDVGNVGTAATEHVVNFFVTDVNEPFTFAAFTPVADAFTVGINGSSTAVLLGSITVTDDAISNLTYTASGSDFTNNDFSLNVNSAHADFGKLYYAGDAVMASDDFNSLTITVTDGVGGSQTLNPTFTLPEAIAIGVDFASGLTPTTILETAATLNATADTGGTGSVRLEANADFFAGDASGVMFEFVNATLAAAKGFEILGGNNLFWTAANVDTTMGGMNLDYEGVNGVQVLEVAVRASKGTTMHDVTLSFTVTDVDESGAAPPAPAPAPTLSLSIEGDDGFNIHDASSSEEDFYVDLRPEASASDGNSEWDLVSIEGFNGGSGDDIFIGTTGKNTFDGGAGNDLFWSRGGADDLNGGDGNDVFVIVGSNTGTNAITYTDTSLQFTAEQLPGYGAVDLAEALSMTLADVNDRDTSEGSVGTRINGGAGTDTIIIYGQVDFTGINRSNIAAERIVLNSVLTLDKEFLEPQTETITMNDGTQEMMELPKIIIEGRGGDSELKIEAESEMGSNGSMTMTVDLSEFEIEGELVVEGTGEAGVVVSTTFVVNNETVQDLAEVEVKLGSGGMKSEVELKAGETVTEETLGSLADILEKSKETLKEDDSVNLKFKDGRDDSETEIMVEVGSDNSLTLMIGSEEAELGGTSTATSGADIIIGMGDDDFIDGLGGNDTLSGGNGDDDINGGIGNDLIGGDNGDDRLSGGDGDDHISGGRGNDRIFGDVGDDVLTGGDGYDFLDGGGDDDTIEGGGGADILNGGAGADDLDGGDGNDRLYGGDGNDTLTGGYGVDTFVISAGTDTISDFANFDLVQEGFGGHLQFDYDITGVDALEDVTFNILVAQDGSKELQVSFTQESVVNTTTLQGGVLVEQIELRGRVNNDAGILPDNYTFNDSAQAYFALRPDILSFVTRKRVDDAVANTITGYNSGDVRDIFTHEGANIEVDIDFTTNKISFTDPNTGQAEPTTYTMSGIEGFHGGVANDTITLSNQSTADIDVNGYAGDDVVILSAATEWGVNGLLAGRFNLLNSDTSNIVTHRIQDVEEIHGTNETDLFRLSGAFEELLFNGAGGADDKLAVYAVLSTREGQQNIYDLRGEEQILAYEVGTGADAFINTINVQNIEIFELQQSRNETVIIGKDSDAFETIDAGNGTDTLRIDSTPDIGETELITANVNLGGEANVRLSNGTTAKLLGIENIIGGRGDDTITGDGEANILDGGEGNDTLDGGGGNDTLILNGEDRIIGGTGDDTLQIHEDYNTGRFTVVGLGVGLGNVEIDIAGTVTTINVSDVEIYDFSNVAGVVQADVTGSRITTVMGGSGDDALSGGGGINNNGGSVFTGGGGLNAFIFTENAGTFTVTDFDGDGIGSNVLDLKGTGVSDINTLNFVKSGNDDTLTIDDTNFSVVLQGAADTIAALEAGASSLAGSQGYNNAGRAYFGTGGAGDNTLFLADEDIVIAGDGDDSGGTIDGTNIDDEIDGAGGDDTINGGGGDDMIEGGDGSDTINGGAGADEVDGEGGDDTLRGSNGDTLTGGTGADAFIYDATDSGFKSPLIITDFDPTEGDTLQFASNTGRDGLFHAGNQSTYATLSFVKNEDFPDFDVIYIDTADQSEILVVLHNADALIDAIGAPDDASFNSLARAYFLKEANTANPDITFEDSIRDDEAANSLTGTNGRDIIHGLEGNDTITGGTGNDVIYGGAGNDIITGGGRAVSYQLEGTFNHMYGGAGDDTFHATGGDTATGGAGADTFIHTGTYGRDFTITDFNTNEDKLVLDNWSTAVINNAPQYIGDGFGLRLVEKNGDNLTLSTLFHTVTLNDVEDVITAIDAGSATSFSLKGQAYFSNPNTGGKFISFTNDGNASPAQQPSPNSFALSVGHVIELNGGTADSQEIEFNTGDRLIFDDVNGVASANSLNNADIMIEDGNVIIDFGAEEVVISNSFDNNLFGNDGAVDTAADMSAFISAFNVEFA